MCKLCEALVKRVGVNKPVCSLIQMKMKKCEAACVKLSKQALQFADIPAEVTI